MCSAMSSSFYTGLNDYDLIVACQQRIEAAFNALFKRYLHHVQGVLRRLAPDPTLNCDDILQDVFTRVWTSIHALRDPRAFKKWLNRLVTNLLYDELRRRKKHFAVSLDDCSPYEDGDESVTRDIPDRRPQPDQTFESNETIAHLNSAFEKLPDQFRNVIVLREFHGLPYEDIAYLTKSELGTVKSRLARAKSKMQFHLEARLCA